MTRSLRWCGRMVAVLSAIVLAGGYVATRAVPGLLQNFQVFGGEGGGRAIPTQPGDRSDEAVFGSSKSAILSGHLIETEVDASPNCASCGRQAGLQDGRKTACECYHSLDEERGDR